jgi:hypothetical protein
VVIRAVPGAGGRRQGDGGAPADDIRAAPEEVIADDGIVVLAAMPEVIDQVALARLYGEPLFALPNDLYIPPEALQVFLEAFEGPLDLLLYLIRKQNFNILDIPGGADAAVPELRRRDPPDQPRARRRIPADGGDADRDQVAHAAAAQEVGRG